MNDTLRMLEKLLMVIHGELRNRDPVWTDLAYSREMAHERFLRAYQDDKVLISAVIELIDAHGRVTAHEAEVDFLLGLQMGLELGQLDLLRGIDVFP